MQTQDLRDALRKALELPPPERPRQPEPGGAPRPRAVVVLGVGSELRSDDAAGVRVAEELAAHPIAGVHALACGAAPENCTAAVRQLRPSHLIIVDAADLGEAPGTVCIVAREAIQSTSFGTHGLPLSVVADYLSQEIGCSISVIGIQPTSLAFGETLSPQVSAAVGETLQALRDCLAPPPEGRQRT